MSAAPRLIIVAGASGAGKSHLVASVVDRDPAIEIVVKLTTRGPRPYEKKLPPRDLRLNCTQAAVTACEYVYVYQKDRYGIRRRDIDEILRRGHHAIVVVRDGRTMERLRHDYARRVLTIWLQSAYSGKDLQKKLKEIGYRDLAAEQRLERSKDDFRLYVQYIDLYDAVLINWYDDTLFEQLNPILYARPTSTRSRPRTGTATNKRSEYR